MNRTGRSFFGIWKKATSISYPVGYPENCHATPQARQRQHTRYEVTVTRRQRQRTRYEVTVTRRHKHGQRQRTRYGSAHVVTSLTYPPSQHSHLSSRGALEGRDHGNQHDIANVRGMVAITPGCDSQRTRYEKTVTRYR